ncbi:MAG: hypothetical protein FDZ70_01355 [Actinobacteria bacterium]|nr:MAG: hypothetical protein FDZ70_01355 [Actinomycetota bacterium]
MAKKLTVLFAVALAAAVLIAPAVAYANFAVHGNYTQDTDACAGCHRAHTSFSSITWSDGTNTHSALLVSSATRMDQFCYACHGADAQGADTNVEEGVYEGTLYGTQNAILNGGGFASLGPTATTSTHIKDGAAWWAWGGGVYGAAASSPFNPATGATGEIVTGMTDDDIDMDCATCHDPHGSSNYRILKDMVYGNRVGGYYGTGSNPAPTPWVWSAEPGYPANGFALHTSYPSYVPNYTTPMYARGETWTVSGTDVDGVSGAIKGMSGWCVGCHGTYLTKTSVYNAGDQRADDATTGISGWGAATVDPFMTRHRHPINVPLSNYAGARALVVTDNPLPLAHNRATESGAITNTATDWVECLTCHRAHGTSAIMTGYADSYSNWEPVPDSNPLAEFGTGVNLAPDGVPPADSSALLRADNRYVCEVCHNK